MPRITAHGLTADLPRGYEGEIYQRNGEGFYPSLSTSGAGVVSPVMHLANFALPPGRGDFGSIAVESMGRGGIFVSLFEHDRAASTTPLFDHPVPWPVRADDFDPSRMQRLLPGLSGGQWFFSTRGRAFCLYVVLGSHTRRGVLVPEVNRLLQRIDVT